MPEALTGEAALAALRGESPEQISTISAAGTDGKPAAPSQTQAAVATDPKPGTAAPDGKAAEDAALEQRLLGEEKPEQKMARLERDLKASSREGQKLNEWRKRVTSLLKEQGLDLVDVEEGTELVPNAKFTKDGKEVSLKFADLPENEQLLAESDRQKFVDAIVARTMKRVARAVPTTEKVIEPVSAEQRAAIVESMKKATTLDGEPEHPGIDANLAFIEKKLSAASTPKALRDFYNQSPELAIGLLNAFVQQMRSQLTASATKEQQRKAEEAKAKAQKPPYGPTSDGGTVQLGKEGPSPKDVAAAIAGARP